MTRTVVLYALSAFWGTAMLLGEIPCVARPPLTERLRPYAPGAPTRPRGGTLSTESFREAFAPLAQRSGRWLAATFGIRDDLAHRLERIHAHLDPTTYRTRQLGWSAAALSTAAICAGSVRPAPAVAALLVIGGPLATFVVLEERVRSAARDWQRRTRAELPVVAEQLAMLLGAGYSMSAALDRLARRRSGVVARDLAVVTQRIRHGLSDVAALREWAERVDLDEARRFVEVLALERETTDLGRLVAAEARTMRHDAHRHLLEAIERRNQLVWIPVTVACLVPGLIFLAVPFLRALSLFAAG